MILIWISLIISDVGHVSRYRFFFFFAIELYVSLIILTPVKYMICKYFLPFYRLPFHFVDGFFGSVEDF